MRDTVENYRVIADYFKRPLAVAELEESAADYGQAGTVNGLVELNNGKFPGWLSNTVSLGWVLFGPRHILTITLGLESPGACMGAARRLHGSAPATGRARCTGDSAGGARERLLPRRAHRTKGRRVFPPRSA